MSHNIAINTVKSIINIVCATLLVWLSGCTPQKQYVAPNVVPDVAPVKPRLSRAQVNEYQDKYLTSCFSIIRRNKGENKVRIVVKPYKKLVPGAGIRDINVGYKFYLREKHYSRDYEVKAIKADGIVVSYSISGENKRHAGEVKLEWKEPLPASAQSQRDKFHHSYLNSRFSVIKRNQDKAHVVVSQSEDWTLRVGFRVLRINDQFFRREKYFSCDYQVKKIEADGIVIGYTEINDRADALGKVKLKWKL